MPKLIIGPANYCLDIKGADHADGTPIILWEQKGGPDHSNQLWNLTAEGYIESFMDAHKCLGIKDGIPNIGAPIVLMKKNGGNHQKWTLNGGRLISVLAPGLCIDAEGAKRVDGTVQLGFSLVLWNIVGSFSGQIWQLTDVHFPQALIQLSYKILVNPSTGRLPRRNVATNINRAIREMNTLCTALNTNFRFNLLEPPVPIGGPNACGHANYWYGARIMTNEHLRSFYECARLFYDPNYPTDVSNAFAWRANAVNIYLTGMGWGGYSAYPENGELIAVCADGDSNGIVQLHEIGHFFGLPHTHDFDGDDGIADTLPDHKDFTGEDLAQRNFNKPYPALTPNEKNAVDNTLFNIMSYHPNRNILTPGQLDRWESVMRNQRKNVILP